MNYDPLIFMACGFGIGQGVGFYLCRWLSSGLYGSTLELHDRAKEILSEWASKEGHDACWYYPDLFRRLCTLFGVAQPKCRDLPPREEFEEGCRLFQDEIYSSPTPSCEDEG